MTDHDPTQKIPQNSASVPDPDTELNLDPDPGDPTPAPPPAPSALPHPPRQSSQVRKIKTDPKYGFIASLIAAVLSLIGLVILAIVPAAWGYGDMMGMLIASSVFFMSAIALSIWSGITLVLRWQANSGTKPLAIAGLLISIGVLLTALLLDIISKIYFFALWLNMAFHG